MIEVRLFATFRDGRDKVSFLQSIDFKKIGDILNHFKISPRETVRIP